MDGNTTNKLSISLRGPVDYFQIALDAIRDLDDVDLTSEQEARLLIEAGKTCDLSGEWDQALESYQRAIELCESDEIRAEALKQTGHIRSKRGEYEAALKAYETSLGILSNLGELSEIGNIYNSIGYNCFQIGHMVKAEEYYGRALKAAEQCDDVRLMADVWGNLGILSTVRGQTDEALDYYQQSKIGYETVGDIHGLAQIYHNLGMAYVDKEEWELAEKQYQKSMELCLEIGDMDLLSVIYANRAKLALNLQYPRTAKYYCDRAIAGFNKTDNKMGIAEAYKLYGVIYSRMHQWKSAETSFRKGIEVCEEYENHLTEAEIYYELGSMSRERKEKEEALQHLQRAVEIYGALGVDQEVIRIRDEIQKIAA